MLFITKTKLSITFIMNNVNNFDFIKANLAFIVEN